MKEVLESLERQLTKHEVQNLIIIADELEEIGVNKVVALDSVTVCVLYNGKVYEAVYDAPTLAWFYSEEIDKLMEEIKKLSPLEIKDEELWLGYRTKS